MIAMSQYSIYNLKYSICIYFKIIPLNGIISLKYSRGKKRFNLLVLLYNAFILEHIVYYTCSIIYVLYYYRILYYIL